MEYGILVCHLHIVEEFKVLMKAHYRIGVRVDGPIVVPSAVFGKQCECVRLVSVDDAVMGKFAQVLFAYNHV